jgi:hypothetical protein
MVEQFGKPEYNKFPCLYNGNAYTFKGHSITTIRESAIRFGNICEVNPKVARYVYIEKINYGKF